jgi:uncharacterized membrane protein YidH (DUF202 family)
MEYTFRLLRKFNEIILNPVIVLMFAVAVLIFIYGIFEYVRNSDSEEARETGRRHMVWGIVGMFIMLSVFGIMSVIINTVGAPTEIKEVIRIP